MSDTVVKSDSLREVFGQTLCDLADPDQPNFYVLGVDLASGCGSHWLRSKYPERHIELGICEQAAIGIAAGLAASTGLPIYLPGFATFLMRGWEPARLAIFHDRRNVRIVCSHLGISSGPDGASVQELSYIATWRSIPNSVLVWPADATELRQVLQWSLEYDGPIVIFTGRNAALPVAPPDYRFTFGKGSLVYPPIDHSQTLYPRTSDVTLIGCGHTVAICVEAAKQLREMGTIARVANLSTLKPVDVEFLSKLQDTSLWLVTVEDHGEGGLFGIVAEALASKVIAPTPIVSIRVEGFGQSGEPDQLYRKYGIGVNGIVKRVRELVE